MQFVITGTDTGVGKTIFAAGLANYCQAHYWKPVQAGLQDATDSEVVRALGVMRIIPEKWKLTAPLSPHAAAKLAGVEIQPDDLTPPALSPLVIEGAGGLCVPLTDTSLFIDIFARWQIPVILCARTALGTINHTLLSLQALQQRSIPIHGIAFIGDEQIDTQNIIANFGKIRVLGRLPFIKNLSVNTLQHAFANNFKDIV